MINHLRFLLLMFSDLYILVLFYINSQTETTTTKSKEDEREKNGSHDASMACPKRLLPCRSQTHKQIVPQISLQYILWHWKLWQQATNGFYFGEKLNTLCGASTQQELVQHFICWILPMLPSKTGPNQK